jgi:imidazole glycerol phosphate synthase glutamine amidotransferase subunit
VSGAVSGYAEKTARLADDLRRRSADGAPAVGLAKSTSNLFRDRAPRKPRVDLSHFDAVVRVDAAARRVEAEGMTTFVDLADATLREGTMPAVVPQLKSITLGGAVAGVGIEATSFRHGLVHDTIVAMDILTGDGRIVTCTADNDHRDLFHGFPNSYGTLGYALKLTARTLPVKPFVRVDHARHAEAERFFAALTQACARDDVDFVDGVAFARGDLVLSCARFVDEAPFTSDYTYERIYYRSLRERAHDYLTTRDYLWRWDTDWFWCSRNVGAQHPLLRRLYGRDRLNSITYQKIMRWNARVGATRALDRPWIDAILAGIGEGRPLLGICLGMQWLYEGSEEAPDLPGLGLIAGSCRRLRPPDDRGGLKVPHVGWNSLEPKREGKIAEQVLPYTQVYFTHSYIAPVTAETVAATEHGEVFASIVERGHVSGVQFHPEKSGEAGLQILRNFVAMAG